MVPLVDPQTSRVLAAGLDALCDPDHGRPVAKIVGGIPRFVEMDQQQLIELEKLTTFDALTPRYDRPMTSRTFRATIESEGFRIEHYHDPPFSPLYCTAVKVHDHQ